MKKTKILKCLADAGFAWCKECKDFAFEGHDLYMPDGGHVILGDIFELLAEVGLIEGRWSSAGCELDPETIQQLAKESSLSAAETEFLNSFITPARPEAPAETDFSLGTVDGLVRTETVSSNVPSASSCGSLPEISSEYEYFESSVDYFDPKCWRIHFREGSYSLQVKGDGYWINGPIISHKWMAFAANNILAMTNKLFPRATNTILHWKALSCRDDFTI